MTARRLFVLGVGALILALAAVAVSAVSFSRRTNEQAVVRGYFEALAAGRAADALGYAAVPPTGEFLTGDVLRQQLRIAPINDIRVGPARSVGSQRQVAVSYRLAGRVGRTVSDQVRLVARGSSWRLQSATVEFDPVVTRLKPRLTLAGRPLTGRVELFPGAVPIATDTPVLRLEQAPTLALDSTGPTRLTPQVDPAEVPALAAVVRRAVGDCLAGRSENVLCPGPEDDNLVPGSARGTTTGGYSLSTAGVRVEDAEPGVVTVHGSVPVRISWKRWTLDDQVVTDTGSVDLSFTMRAAVTSPLALSFVVAS